MKKQKAKNNTVKTPESNTVSGIYAQIPAGAKYAVLWIIILAVVFVVFSMIFGNLGVVRYEGLTFTKEKVGSIPVYHYYYLYDDANGQLVQNNIYLRTNPAKNPVSVSGNVTFIENRTVYIGIDTDHLNSCNDSSVAIATLAGFLKNGGLNVKGGALNQTVADKLNTTYVECNIFNPVIKIRMTNATKVVNSGICYDIQAATCSDVIPAVEKFIVGAILDAKASTLEELRSMQNTTK